MSHWRMLKKIDEFGKDFDKLATEWKSNLEHSCKKKSVLSTITEVVEEAEVEVIPGGLDTINVAGLGLSFPDATSDFVDDVQQDTNTAAGQCFGQEIDTSLSVFEIRERVKLKMGSRFDKQAFDFLVGEIVNTNISINTRELQALEKRLQMVHPPTYQITGDNLDLMVKVKHMSSTNQNNSIHWFNLNAVQNRVLANHLPNDQPIKPVMELENVEFLPSPKDNEAYLHDITALVTRTVVKNIPALSKFKDTIVKHIPHKYSDEMKEKSTQVCS